ncbi:hypothetical protein BN1708_020183 [Verticillium longisporum]|uniref:Uncharacterized protein n=1 Tax=Verticillium longisporum TaxID=100787 RepID=A0A0G4MRZ8_VERLO|nr:hypothetical protein BN1708_020183 [Verticillium longisporum]
MTPPYYTWPSSAQNTLSSSLFYTTAPAP